MSGVLVEQIPTAFTGDMSTRKRLYKGPGYAGLTHRWLAEYYSGVADGTLLSTWADVVGLSPLVMSTTGGIPSADTANAPTKQTVSGVPVIRFDGVDDAMMGLANAGLPSAMTNAEIVTLQIVLKGRANTPSWQPLRAGGAFTRASGANQGLTMTKYDAATANPTTLAIPATSPGGVTGDLDIANAFRVLTLVGGGYAGGGNHVAVNGSMFDMVIPGGRTTRGNELSFIIGGGPIDVLEINAVGRALTEAETDASYAALKLKYPTLVL